MVKPVLIYPTADCPTNFGIRHLFWILTTASTLTFDILWMLKIVFIFNASLQSSEFSTLMLKLERIKSIRNPGWKFYTIWKIGLLFFWIQQIASQKKPLQNVYLKTNVMISNSVPSIRHFRDFGNRFMNWTHFRHIFPPEFFFFSNFQKSSIPFYVEFSTFYTICHRKRFW